MTTRKTIGDAFGGQLTTLEEQRRIWADALHEDAIWEGPMFERPVVVIGREATEAGYELQIVGHSDLFDAQRATGAVTVSDLTVGLPTTRAR